MRGCNGQLCMYSSWNEKRTNRWKWFFYENWNHLLTLAEPFQRTHFVAYARLVSFMEKLHNIYLVWKNCFLIKFFKFIKYVGAIFAKWLAETLRCRCTTTTLFDYFSVSGDWLWLCISFMLTKQIKTKILMLLDKYFRGVVTQWRLYRVWVKASLVLRNAFPYTMYWTTK